MADAAVVITCEHAGYAIPGRVRRELTIPRDVLLSHRGWDAGTLELARRFSEALSARLHHFSISRLVVDANRSPESPELFSEFSRTLPQAVHEDLMRLHYGRFREAVRARVQRLWSAGHCVVHLSVHSFTPVWKGRKRSTDIGVLFDPARRNERNFCRLWTRELRGALPDFAIHSNKPYRGADDGHTTSLRRVFDERYLGIELEVNQKFVGTPRWSNLCDDLVLTFRDTIREASPYGT